MCRASSGAVRFLCLWLLVLPAIACNRAEKSFTRRPAPTAPRFDSEVHRPKKLESIETGSVTPAGIKGRVPCETCHSLRAASELPRDPSRLTQFHKGLQFAHGELVCASCHAEGNPPTLHLANSERVPMVEAMRLCAQCHGPQYRDYRHGAHGGMLGYWDLSSGPRSRNNCVDCHDPHTPKIPQVVPAPAPRDRFVAEQREDSHGRQ